MSDKKRCKIEEIEVENSMKRNVIIYVSPLEQKTLAQLGQKTGTQVERIKRLLNLPDLSEKENSPIKFVRDRIFSLPSFQKFNIVKIPRIVSVKDNFDLLNIPIDHPSRRKTDTYYIDRNTVLCTQTTDMWSFCLQDAKVLKKLKTKGHIGILSSGIVYRKDTIDRNHYPSFHQIEGLYICKKSQKLIVKKDLVKVLVEVAKGIFGQDVQWNIKSDTFPYTNPSIEMNIKRNNKWIEVLGAGIVDSEIYPNFNLDPSVYNGWAFGFGLERLAMAKMNIPDIRIFWSKDERITKQFKNIDSQYREVSKYPPVYKDISFIADKSMDLQDYYELIRKQAGDLVEEVKLLDQYENKKKFGENKISHTFRIIYRSHEKTLTDKKINEIQEKIMRQTQEELGVTLRIPKNYKF